MKKKIILKFTIVISAILIVVILIAGSICINNYNKLVNQSIALQECIRNHDVSGVKRIIEVSPKCVNTRNTNSPDWLCIISNAPPPYYPLQSAVACYDYDIIKLLLENGADCNIRCKVSYSTKTPLIYMSDLTWEQGDTEQQLKTAKLLLDYGADKTITDYKGKTAYDYAVDNGYTELAKLIKP